MVYDVAHDMSFQVVPNVVFVSLAVLPRLFNCSLCLSIADLPVRSIFW